MHRRLAIRVATIAFVLLSALAARPALGLRVVMDPNKAYENDSLPAKVVKALNAAKRVYGIGESLYYAGDTAQLNEMLKALATLRDQKKAYLTATFQAGRGRETGSGRELGKDITFDYNWSVTLDWHNVQDLAITERNKEDGNTVIEFGKADTTHEELWVRVEICIDGPIDLAAIQLPLEYDAAVGKRVEFFVEAHNKRRTVLDRVFGPQSKGSETRPTSEQLIHETSGGIYDTSCDGNSTDNKSKDGNSAAAKAILKVSAYLAEQPSLPDPQTRPARAWARTRPAAQTRPASRVLGPVHGDFGGTAAEFLAAALKDPDVGIFNPPADQDPYGSLGAQERMKKVARAAGMLMLYPDATAAEFNPAFRDRLRHPWPGASATGYHRAWYPDGKAMLVEHFTDNGLTKARYYDPNGKLLSKIDDGDGLALQMDVNIQPGQVRGELRYAKGKPANADGRFGESKYASATKSSRAAVGFEQKLSTSWSGALGLAAGAVEFVKSHPTADTWKTDGVGTIWQDGQKAFGLRGEDGAIFATDDGGATARRLQPGLDCPPCGIVIEPGVICLWGAVATAEPERGIPSRIVLSRDAGRTWVKTSAPIDYMVGLRFQQDNLLVDGRYLPAGGLKAGEHWFLLYPWIVMTTHGQKWTKSPDPFGGTPEIIKRMPVGDRGATVYVVQQPGFLDPGDYQVLVCLGLDRMPILAASAPDKPEAVLADDGQSLRVTVNGKLVSTTDIRTGKVTKSKP